MAIGRGQRGQRHESTHEQKSEPGGVEPEAGGSEQTAHASVTQLDAPAEPDAVDATASKEQDSPGLENVYSKDDIQKLIDDSKNIQQLLNQRLKNQNSAINQ